MKALGCWFLILSLILQITGCLDFEGKEESGLLNIIQGKSPIIDTVIKDPKKYRLQILYTQIDRDTNNTPSFRSYSFAVNEKKYFYPASTVKFPAAVLALEKLNRLNVERLDKYSPLRIDSAYSGQTSVIEDSTALDLKPTIAQYIKKIFLVSDNDAFNRLYEFLGQKYLNESLWNRGYHSIQLIRRLEATYSPEENRATNPFTFFNNGDIIFHQPLMINEKPYRVEMDEIRQGKGFYRGGELVKKPIDFSYSNYFSIPAQQKLMRAIMFPGSVPAESRFDLNQEDFSFLYRYMSMLPREGDIKAYHDTTNYYDSYLKFFIFGDSREKIPANIRVFNKSGQAYGYLLDNAYIIDLEKRIEFLLTAVLQVNENQIYNDDTYEYDTIGLPFLAELGRIIYQYEIGRTRDHFPDLSKFRF
jgi:hypothetical protein